MRAYTQKKCRNQDESPEKLSFKWKQKQKTSKNLIKFKSQLGTNVFKDRFYGCYIKQIFIINDNAGADRIPKK